MSSWMSECFSALRQKECFRTDESQSQSHLSLASLIMPKFELFEIRDLDWTILFRFSSLM